MNGFGGSFALNPALSCSLSLLVSGNPRSASSVLFCRDFIAYPRQSRPVRRGGALTLADRSQDLPSPARQSLQLGGLPLAAGTARAGSFKRHT